MISLQRHEGVGLCTAWRKGVVVLLVCSIGGTAYSDEQTVRDMSSFIGHQRLKQRLGRRLPVTEAGTDYKHLVRSGRLMITGKSGNGKTHLLQAIEGELNARDHEPPIHTFDGLNERGEALLSRLETARESLARETKGGTRRGYVLIDNLDAARPTHEPNVFVQDQDQLAHLKSHADDQADKWDGALLKKIQELEEAGATVVVTSSSTETLGETLVDGFRQPNYFDEKEHKEDSGILDLSEPDFETRRAFLDQLTLVSSATGKRADSEKGKYAIDESVDLDAVAKTMETFTARDMINAVAHAGRFAKGRHLTTVEAAQLAYEAAVNRRDEFNGADEQTWLPDLDAAFTQAVGHGLNRLVGPNTVEGRLSEDGPLRQLYLLYQDQTNPKGAMFREFATWLHHLVTTEVLHPMHERQQTSLALDSPETSLMVTAWKGPQLEQPDDFPDVTADYPRVTIGRPNADRSGMIDHASVHLDFDPNFLVEHEFVAPLPAAVIEKLPSRILTADMDQGILVVENAKSKKTRGQQDAVFRSHR